MLSILALATLSAITSPANAVMLNFTSDSVYKHESVISCKEVVEQEDGKYTLILEPAHLLGYCIYDKDDTAYIDGLKFNDEFVYNYTITDIDVTQHNTILVKTVYTEDVAGMLAAAKDGDYTKLLSNPLIVIQLAYYILAAVSLIAGGFGLFKSKKAKIKDHNEIAATVKTDSREAKEDLVNTLKGVIAQQKAENQNIIKAIILSQSNDPNSKLALVNLLDNSLIENNYAFSESVTKEIKEAESKKEEAAKILKNIAEGTLGDTDVRF